MFIYIWIFTREGIKTSNCLHIYHCEILLCIFLYFAIIFHSYHVTNVSNLLYGYTNKKLSDNRSGLCYVSMLKPNPPPSLQSPRLTLRELGDVHEIESAAYAIFFVLAFGYSLYNISPDTKEVESGLLNFSSETPLFVHVKVKACKYIQKCMYCTESTEKCRKVLNCIRCFYISPYITGLSCFSDGRPVGTRSVKAPVTKIPTAMPGVQKVPLCDKCGSGIL